MAGSWRRLRGLNEKLTAQPGYALVGVLRIPQRRASPARVISRRVVVAVVALLLTAGIVYVDRDGYLDAQGDRLTFLDCLYYAAVTLSTTGYGDITPISEFARAINIFVITPLRIAFLILLVGTTLEVLTETSRQAYKIQRWRSRVRNHTVVIGYGTKGKTAVAAMVSDELVPGEIVVVDTDSGVLERAAAAGLVTVHGDATKSDVLRLAGTQHASSIIVATSRDDTAVLVTLTAREIAPKAKIVASIREAENQHLLRQSGADTVVVSSETAGRLLGIATTTPSVVEMIEDLLTPEAGLAVAEREVEQAEVGGSPRHLRDIVLGVDFQLRSVPLLSRVGADRADRLRTDMEAAAAGWPGAALLRVDSRNRVLVANGRVLLGAAIELADKPPPEAVFLGRVEGGRHVWAVRAALQPIADPDIPAEAVDLRGLGRIMDDTSSQLVSSASALLNWHDNARFSALDGAPTKPARAGWSRVNPITGHEEFPRIDPAVICLVHDGADRAVLARQAAWPERMFSLLAGFVEAGESFEVCVAREIREEIGLTVRDVRYLGSQQWPFPRSLMVGFHALGDPDEEFSFSDGEIAEAAWFTRDEVRAALAAGDWSSASESKLLLPGSISIARVIIESWAACE